MEIKVLERVRLFVISGLFYGGKGEAGMFDSASVVLRDYGFEGFGTVFHGPGGTA